MAGKEYGWESPKSWIGKLIDDLGTRSQRQTICRAESIANLVKARIPAFFAPGLAPRFFEAVLLSPASLIGLFILLISQMYANFD